MQRGAALSLLAILLLSGCAGRQVQPDAGIDWNRRAGLLASESAWSARGRIGFRSDRDGGQASLNWVQGADGTRISLAGPFGAGAYEIQWDAEQVVVNSRKGEQIAAYTGHDAADRFVEQQLGWSFPATSIRYWLLGIADPAYDSTRSFDDAGWLASIEQNGWYVEYSRFDRVEAHYMPGKIVAENDRARLKLIIDHWSF